MRTPSTAARRPELTSAPAVVREDLARLRTALDASVPGRTGRNLLLATWNVRALGGLTPAWSAGEHDSPKRDWHALVCIAEVLSRFDVVAVQEARREPTALRLLLWLLGPDWRVVASDVTEGSRGNGERLAFVYHAGRVEPSGLVGEIVLPPVVDEPVRQFARTPYAVSFTRGGLEFVLTTVHVVWGGRPSERLPEVAAFAEWMRAWHDRPNDWNSNLMVLGDFNLDRLDDPLYQAFVSTGLFPPAELNGVPRTIFADDRSRHFYDQIAWFSSPTGESLLDSLVYTRRGGSFDFVPHVLRDLSRVQLSWRISDHYPLWVELTY